MSRVFRFTTPLTCLALTAFVGCGSSSPTSGSPPAENEPVESSTAATWTQVYTNVISQHCGPCHTTAAGSGVTEGKLDMSSQPTAYANLVGVEAAGAACVGKGLRVAPGMEDSSVLYLKVSLDDPSPCGSKMPLDEGALSQSDVDMIESWIVAGALNN